jgi:hypothetical protein
MDEVEASRAGEANEANAALAASLRRRLLLADEVGQSDGRGGCRLDRRDPGCARLLGPALEIAVRRSPSDRAIGSDNELGRVAECDEADARSGTLG